MALNIAFGRKCEVLIARRERQVMRHSCHSLVIRVGQELADSCQKGTPHSRGFLCQGMATMALSETLLGETE
jgi:hypothetical protein